MELSNTLKKATLLYAMSGKLTKKDKNDTNIEEYYNFLVSNKKNNIESKKWKKENEVEHVDNSVFEYDLNDNWKWIYLGDIVAIRGGKRIPAGRTLSSAITPQKYIRVADMKNHTVLMNEIKYVPNDLINKLEIYRISKEDLYITVAGTIGDIGEIPDELDGANLTENANKIVLEGINKKWLMLCLLSDSVQKQIAEATTVVGQPKLAIRRIQSLSIPLCCLEEQQRIVEKVEKIFKEIDVIEKLENQLLVINKNFNLNLEQSILQSAVRGLLAEQCKKDSEVVDLIEKIKNTKDKLVKSKKIKKDKTSCINEEELPFEIPDNWKWVKLGDIALLKTGKTPPRAEKKWWGKEGDYPWFSISDMISNSYVSKTKEFISEEGFIRKFGGNVSPKGTLIMSFKLTIGRTSILNVDALHNEAIISIFPFYDKNHTIRNHIRY